MLPYAAFVSWANLAIWGRFCFLILKLFFVSSYWRDISGGRWGEFLVQQLLCQWKKTPFCSLLLLRKVFYYLSFLHWSWHCCSQITIHITSMDANLSEQWKSVESCFLFNWFQWELKIATETAPLMSAQRAFLWTACTANESASFVNKRKDDIFCIY